ncbi:MAG: prepilin-type N-terminal cleavage/methylation domain-containing protein [Polyangiaceae bacterium]|nr:prepilin-type N-terminal cleavage/methylation domain-containing protein [Polyangiaceae bacterium]
MSVFLPPVPIPGDGSRRGFTAVELMVAITTALVVCAGAYSLAKTSLEAFQQEARMNAAQYNNVMGMNRLVTDIKRAGFQTSPDAATDAQVCVVPGATQSALLRAVNVTEGATGYGVGTGVGALVDYPTLPVEVTGLTNRRAPDRIRLSANYATSERFKFGAVDLAGDRISVQVDQLPVQRVFKEFQFAGAPSFCAMFPAGNLARIVDAANRSRFIEVAACADPVNGAGSNYQTILITAVDIPNGLGCGEATDGFINPVNVIDYAPMRLTAATAAAHGFGPTLTALMDQDAAIAGIVGDNSRLALVRRELLANGAPRPNTATIAADYVADLNFNGRFATDPLNPSTLTFADFNAATPIGNVPDNQVRALGVRLTTRSRYPDRTAAPAAPTEDQALPRFEVFQAAATNRNRFARVRTFYNEVTISNLQGIPPWP